ncbi:MAG: peptidylprolyl isomerase [Burkholderiales bacterium]|nr:peptidylprolyl isomerase [Burkholderiales bacterium]
MKKISLIFMAFISICYADTKSENESSVNTQPTVNLNKIAAYVNKRIITQNELNQQIQQTLYNLKQQGIQNTQTADLSKNVLDQMIVQQVQLDMANRSGIKTTDAEINSTIANIEKNQNISDAQMMNKLSSQGVTMNQFRQQISDQITLEKLKQREVDGRVFVNDDEVTRVINSEAYKKRVDYNLSNILITIPEQATQAIVQQKSDIANSIIQQLSQGQKFEQLAIKYSNGQNALSGGEIGWKSNTSLPPQVLDQLRSLPIGGTTGAIKFPIGFMIFKVNGIKQHGTPQIVKQYHVRHILIKVNELTSDDEAERKIDGLYNKLAKDKNDKAAESAEFTELSKQYSDDPGSAIKGGDIGWTSKGDTVPQFEQTILATPVGEISKPFRSPFGWHILQVMETRDSNMANEKERTDIRQELRETKAQVLYTEWIRNIKDTAYIKINND